MVRALVGAVRFFWTATAGTRLRPWRSEYLRWRVETYSGKPAGSLKIRDFAKMFMDEPGQMIRFFQWSQRLQGMSHGERG
jgi:hypothetical protein